MQLVQSIPRRSIVSCISFCFLPHTSWVRLQNPIAPLLYPNAARGDGEFLASAETMEHAAKWRSALLDRHFVFRNYGCTGNMFNNNYCSLKKIDRWEPIYIYIVPPIQRSTIESFFRLGRQEHIFTPEQVVAIDLNNEVLLHFKYCRLEIIIAGLLPVAWN